MNDSLNLKNSKERPLVSVALAVRNGLPFLRQQLDSLLTQTYANIEIIISDDQSTDDTPKVLNEYVSRDSRVSWSTNPNPEGLSKNFERVFGLCKGEVIFPCDADDVWMPDRIEKHMSAYEDSSIDWVYNRSVLIDSEGKIFGRLEDVVPDYFIKKRTMRENAWGSCIGGMHGSYRASVLKRAMPLDPEAGAYDCWIQLAIWPARSKFIDEVLVHWRRHDTNQSIWGEKDTAAERERKESLAIRNNRRLIESIIGNRNLPLWKRAYFFFVLYGKDLRDWYRYIKVKIFSRSRQWLLTDQK